MALIGGLLYFLLRPAPQPQFGGPGGVAPAPQPAPAAPLHAKVLRLAGQTTARNFALIMVPRFQGPDSREELTILKSAAPGSFVRKGDLIVALDGQRLQDHIDDVLDLVAQADNDVKKQAAEQSIDMAALEQNLRQQKAELDKARLDLKAAEVRTEIEREILRLSAEEAEASYKALLADVSRRKEADRAGLRILEITAIRQRRHLQRHQNDFKRFNMYAPIDGLVVMAQVWRSGEMRQVQEGDLVSPGQQIMRVVDTSKMQLEARVSQADSSFLRVGQTARIGLDAFPELQFEGRVASIGALAVKGMWDTYYIRNVPVRLEIIGNDPRLIPDLSAWAEIRISDQQTASAR
jgi:multidrug efflux pump subunit AcrA (membrane-fusion protein)